MTTAKPIIYTGTGSAIDNYKSPKPVGIKTDNWGKFKASNPKHKKIMSLVRQKQWLKPHPVYGEVADMDGQFADWLQSSRSPVNKPLMKMDNIELEKTIVALRGVVRHNYKRKKL